MLAYNKNIIGPKRLLFLIIFLIIAVKLYYAYVPSTEIEVNTSIYDFQYLVNMKISPDAEHTLHVYLNKENKNSEIGYLEVLLLPDKVIFWEEVKSNELENIIVNGTPMEYWVDCEWIDNEHIQIHGIIVDINKGYDYRKN